MRRWCFVGVGVGRGVGGDNNASDQPDPVQETGHHHQL